MCRFCDRCCVGSPRRSLAIGGLRPPSGTLRVPSGIIRVRHTVPDRGDLLCLNGFAVAVIFISSQCEESCFRLFRWRSLVRVTSFAARFAIEDPFIDVNLVHCILVEPLERIPRKFQLRDSGNILGHPPGPFLDLSPVPEITVPPANHPPHDPI